ncbi:hypothetical protein RRG08_035103 [Elysia crispata]|uniref:Uncharacterized protein n=1 Tax=Elysia crispata TaxID=231223 RepID=A0AAE1DLC6_9GAST|nr:hypothetical protein RRG08_035103 [Elysia crispata]
MRGRWAHIPPSNTSSNINSTTANQGQSIRADKVVSMGNRLVTNPDQQMCIAPSSASIKTIGFPLHHLSSNPFSL